MDLEWNSHRKAVGNRSHQSENRVHRNASASDFRRPYRRRSRFREPLGFAGSAWDNSIRGALDRSACVPAEVEMKERISVWEGEGGSLNETSEKALTGTVNQIEWAKQIKTQVNAEFDRVKTALEAAAARQSGQDRMDTQAMIAILQDKRAEVMAHE